MRSFSVTVVDRAISCPLLLYACLAVSARHLSNTSKAVPPELADSYHERCIGILLPILEDGHVTTSLDTLLAATVILRLFEQMSCMRVHCTYPCEEPCLYAKPTQPRPR